MQNQYQRMERLFGADAVAKLRAKRVAVFGVGGVGGSVVEALARSGVGTIDVIDNDTVDPTNINRQALASWKSVGRLKVDVAEERIHDIDPDIVVHKYPMFYLPAPENKPDTCDAACGAALRDGAASSDGRECQNLSLDFSNWDYVVDAIDTVTGKIGIILEAKRLGIPVLSCMGCGNRVDPTKLTVCDIYKTEMDPLAKVMRHELRKRGVKELTVVYSTEPAICPVDRQAVPAGYAPVRRDIPGSSAFVPPAAGMIAASVVVRELTEFNPGDRVKGSRK